MALSKHERRQTESNMIYQLSKQMDLWHEHDGIISEPTELARHMERNRGNASIIVKAIATDFERAVDPIIDALRQGYDEEYPDDDACSEDSIFTLSLRTHDHWSTPAYNQETWDTLTEVLDWIGLSDELKRAFTDKLLTECLPLIDPLTFSSRVQDAIELIKEQRSDFNEEDVITVAASLITGEISETLISRGEGLALYSTIKLILEVSN